MIATLRILVLAVPRHTIKVMVVCYCIFNELLLARFEGEIIFHGTTLRST